LEYVVLFSTLLNIKSIGQNKSPYLLLNIRTSLAIDPKHYLSASVILPKQLTFKIWYLTKYIGNKLLECKVVESM